MFKTLSNDLFTGAEIQAAEQRQIEKLIEKLTPNGSKSEIANLIVCVEKIKKQLTELKCDADPRMFNNPLLNDSRMTYKFGARAYESDCYPGYVWRNGNWFKITPELQFEPTPKVLVTQRPDPTGAADQSYSSSIFCIIDDSFYPVLINGTRLFVKEVFTNADYNGNVHTKLSGMYAYFPYHNHIINTGMIPNFYPNGRPKTYVHQGMKIEYEDFDNMQDVK